MMNKTKKDGTHQFGIWVDFKESKKIIDALLKVDEMSLAADIQYIRSKAQIKLKQQDIPTMEESCEVCD